VVYVITTRGWPEFDGLELPRLLPYTEDQVVDFLAEMVCSYDISGNLHYFRDAHNVEEAEDPDGILEPFRMTALEYQRVVDALDDLAYTIHYVRGYDHLSLAAIALREMLGLEQRRS
jgi:hypothetical protein